MEQKDIIVIGASAGGFEVLKTIMAGLPDPLQAAIFIVWHMAPDLRGVLPEVLAQITSLPVTNAIDREPVQMGRIYVAPPDRHLLLEAGLVRLSRGPKENRFRPAIDPLFRSAAYYYGPRVIGVILSGALDDGSSGLFTVKAYGGTAIVQDPDDAEISSMPENALRYVEADYVVPATGIASLLVQLCGEPAAGQQPPQHLHRERTAREISISLQDENLDRVARMPFNTLTPYTCPECHGVLSSVRENGQIRYRCHTGHAYSTDTLLSEITDHIEDNIWNAVRGIEESVMLLNQLGDHYSGVNNPGLAALYFQQSRQAGERLSLLHVALRTHERLTTEKISESVLPNLPELS